MSLLRPTFDRLQDLSAAAKVAVFGGAAFQFVYQDAFAYLFFVLLASNIADWIFGRHAAHARRDPVTNDSEFSSTKSRNGAVAKGAQLTVLLLLRSLEGVIPLIDGIPDIMGVGIGSSALALVLIVEDVESIERHSITLGGKGIPLLSGVLSRLRMLTGGDRRNPNETVPPSQALRRRSTDPPGASADA